MATGTGGFVRFEYLYEDGVGLDVANVIWTGEIVSMPALQFSNPPVDFTHLQSGVFHEMRPSDRIQVAEWPLRVLADSTKIAEAFQLPHDLGDVIDVRYPANKRSTYYANVVDTWLVVTLQLPSGDEFLAGTGFMTDLPHPSSENGIAMEGQVSFQFDGRKFRNVDPVTRP